MSKKPNLSMRLCSRFEGAFAHVLKTPLIQRGIIGRLWSDQRLYVNADCKERATSPL